MINIAALGLYMLISNISSTPATVNASNLENTASVVQTLVKEEPTNEIDKNVEQVVREYFADIPVMAEVSRCESHFTQFTKNGNVLRGRVVPQDVGVMQINETYHLERSKKLGMDIYTLEGNLAYARFLYERGGDNGDGLGTRPWLASFDCWKSSVTLDKTIAPANS